MAHPHIVHARPPRRQAGPIRPAPRDGVPADAPPVPAEAAEQAFAALRGRWRLPSGEAWRMLTGRGHPPAAWDGELARRVALLVAIEAVMATVVSDVPAWATTPNPGPLLMGASPVGFLSRLGTPGYVALLRQVRRWAVL